MPGNLKQELSIEEYVNALVDEKGHEKAELIPILHEINAEKGYISDDAIKALSKRMKIPSSQIYSVVTFYRMLSHKPRGRHVIQFCESAPCHVAGGQLVFQELQNVLGLSGGETSEDGKWTLITTSCLGICGVGPVLIVDHDIYGNVTPDQIPEILGHYD
jgi:NADH:ubiquinone oxidoreductase subunit E